MRVPPSHSPPTAISKDSEPFFQLLSTGHTGTDSSVLVHQSDVSPSSQRTGKDISASQYLSSSQLVSDQQTVRSASSPKRTGIDSSASQRKPDRPRSSSPRRTGKDSSVSAQQSASQPRSDRNQPIERAGTDLSAPSHSSASKVQSDRPESSLATDTGSRALDRQRRGSSSSSRSASASDYSDRPLVDLYAEEGELSEDQDLTTTEP